MSTENSKDLVAALVRSQRETDIKLRQTQEETNRQLRELGKQIGGLGNKFSSPKGHCRQFERLLLNALV